MKKILCVCVAVLLAVLFLGSGVLFAAEIIYLAGKVQVQSPTDVDWREAQLGMSVDIGDSIRTARHSSVDIALDDEKKNTIHLGEKTLIVLNSASAGAIDRVDLSRGRVYANMEGIKEGLSFEVNTPSAVAGVRGSSYMVYSDRDSDEISAYKHTVFLKTFDEQGIIISETMLPQGFKTFIERFAAPGAFTQIHKREFDRFDRIKDGLISSAEGRERIEPGRHEGGPGTPQDALEQAAQRVEEHGGVVDQVLDAKDSTDEQSTQRTLDEARTPTTPTHEEEYEYGHEMP